VNQSLSLWGNLLMLDSFNRNESISTNMSDAIDNFGLTSKRVINGVSNGECDNNLLANAFPSLYASLAKVTVNPMYTLSYFAVLELEGQKFIAPTVGSLRVKSDAGTGFFGAYRSGGYLHQGIDINAKEGE
jgi:hypothetical protein